MLRIKKLDIFIVKSFFMLFIGTFFICLFIFMMQFLWRYVDELVGKGLEMSVMAQFFFYSALTLVPVSLPLAVLLASLITFGNFGERYELLAMKAAGISLLKIMRPLAFFVCGIVGVSFYFQNVVGPIAQAKLGTLILSMKQKSPELDIPEGVFYSEIPDYNLKIAKKDRKTGMLYDVLIYNLKDGFENAHIIYADSGRMEMTADKQHLWLHLFSGDLFENLKSQTMKSQNVPYRRETFREKHTIIEFNSDFNMVDGDIMGKQSSAKDMKLLQSSIDSMTVVGDSIGRQYYREVAEGNFRSNYSLTKEDTAKIEKADIRAFNVDSLYDVASLNQKQKVLSSAVSRAENMSSDLTFKTYTMENNDYSIRKHKTEWHKKITIRCPVCYSSLSALRWEVSSVRADWGCRSLCRCWYLSFIISLTIRDIRWHVTVNGLYGWGCGPVAPSLLRWEFSSRINRTKTLWCSMLMHTSTGSEKCWGSAACVIYIRKR